ncbi:hypothetical protein A3J43_04300 [Candidatus Uhrbacteria bacterium RIFCSPHIGHO2_12_FULL_54_23]|uniref:Uncharacterized protein n=3 Tax=Candidatus Uhriibacteriota TaxID=1752732 RepID=A0A1F7UJ98_9BACT|nr:MAG: hypothetical protein A3J43_04300 [Candidatus Uhrbacteria bacterium RIFCSPHIGHO2_12_FULL_54_23]OGL80969.1 MAG: hypothetical protein A2936_02310 [Candidatus Uhrbacteria bacterium RIFCSPLOWO2_01_FULL_47_25]OGL90227.1 MAG: hypothetical protein A3J36_00385 [Candidatus Uhrbacteria bacterium RIFCSPLOWO2_02_FULL_54_37]
MHIEIDQSGKIEDTSHDTVVAFSNDVNHSVVMRARDKRRVEAIFRRMGKRRVFMYKLFAILVFLLIKPYLARIDVMVIDTEYPDWEHLIKDYLLRLIRRVRPSFDARRISFRSVGRHSGAHAIANGTARGEMAYGREASLREVMQYV